MNRSTQSLMCQQDEPISENGIEVCYCSIKQENTLYTKKFLCLKMGYGTHVLICSNIFIALMLILPFIN